MNSPGNFQFSRRTLLRAAGSTLLVPVFLREAFSQTAPVRPNLAILMQTNGVNQANFWPAAGTFDSPILNKMLADPAVGPKTTLIKGIDLKLSGSPAGNGHDWGWHSLFSGRDNIAGSGGQFGGGPTVDQTLLKKLDKQLTAANKHIHCGVHAADYRLINAGRISFSCATAGKQLPCELNVYALYEKVFGPLATTGTPPSAGDAEAAARRLAQRKSVMDAVAKDLQALQGRLGPAEREKVDAHLSAVRDFELRLSNTIAPGTGTGMTPASCGTLKPFKASVPTTGQGNEVNADTLFKLFMEFIANALACNVVNILTFQFGRGGEHFHYNWLNIPGMRPDFHDEIAHKDNGSDATATRVMVEVGKYYTDIVLDLGKRLAAFPQGEGKTALDGNLVVWANELATGPHGIKGVPIVLLGGAAGKLKKTGYMVNSGTQVHHRLGATLHHVMGDPVAGFGAEANCGVLQGLELA